MPTRAHTHTPPHQWYKSKRADTIRPTAAQRGYGWRWSQYSKAYLIANPVCARCHEPATCVDHIEPVSGPDDQRFWQEDNFQPLCRNCHNLKTKREDRGKGRAER